MSKGKVLARSGTDLLEASFVEAAAELEQTKFEFNKMTNLFDRKAVSKQELTMATSTFHQKKDLLAFCFRILLYFHTYRPLITLYLD